MRPLLLLFISFNICIQLNAQVFSSSNLPVISIQTNGQQIIDEPKITADMGIVFNSNNARNNLTDPFNHYNGKIGIEIRGQSSQQFPMKSYSIELWDNTGNSLDKSLFGLPKESDWVLYAPYNDKTLMRNFLAYTMSREMGRWAANCRYVELFINNEYKGIYVFMEKIKRNSGRVNIPKLSTADITGDAVTGGYIFSIDKEADAWYSNYPLNSASLNKKIHFSYVYPKITSIVTEQRNYIKSYVDSFENAIASDQFRDTVIGWRKYADESSFIDYLIVNELSHNVDAYRLSSYFYKDKASKGGKIIAGPVWDYDLAFRNANYCNGSNTDGWVYDFNRICPDDFWQIPFWWSQFASDPGFQFKLRCRWKELRQTSLSVTRINNLIDSVAQLTSEARERHFQKWPVLGQYIWPNPQPIATTYTTEIEYLKAWIQARITWLDENMPNEGPCLDYPLTKNESFITTGLPNPVQSVYTVTIKSKMKQQIQIRGVDLAGRILYTKMMELNNGFNQVQINMNNWQTGIYILFFKTDDGTTTQLKVLKSL